MLLLIYKFKLLPILFCTTFLFININVNLRLLIYNYFNKDIILNHRMIFIINSNKINNENIVINIINCQKL